MQRFLSRFFNNTYNQYFHREGLYDQEPGILKSMIWSSYESSLDINDLPFLKKNKSLYSAWRNHQQMIFLYVYFNDVNGINF